MADVGLTYILVAVAPGMDGCADLRRVRIVDGRGINRSADNLKSPALLRES